MTGQYRARTWQTLRVFDRPVSPACICVEESGIYREPKGLKELVKQSWDMQLAAKKADLATKEPGSIFEIRPYGDGSLNALYLGDKPKMWPGGAVTLVTWYGALGCAPLILEVGETCFPMIDGLKDPAIRALYDAQGISIPRPPLAVVTTAQTADNKLIMTVRGSRTNMYPDRVYGQGGNPMGLFDVEEHQGSETQDEIMVPREKCLLDEMGFLGLIEDNEGLPNKPDLVGYLPVDMESGRIAELVRKRHAEGRSPNDAVDVEVVDRTDGGLIDYLVKQPPEHFCPPSQAMLVLYGNHTFGPDWTMSLKKKADWLHEVPDNDRK